jgi:glycosyltransferase involved in cell wall biosynthesis
MRKPTLSVLTPTYNRASFLKETMDSVLSQAFQDFEYIVIDDGSQDDSASVVEPYLSRVQYIRQDNVGETRTVNRAYQMARGDFITIVNSDDPLLPGAFDRVIAALEAEPEALCAYPDWVVIDTESKRLQDIRLISYDLKTLFTHGFVSIGPGLIYRRQVLDLVGFRNPQIRYSADLDLIYRTAMISPLVHVPEVLATHRVHPGSGLVAALGSRFARETAFISEVHGRHPLLPPDLRRITSLADAHGFFAAMFTCRSRTEAARYLARGLMANPIALLERLSQHGFSVAADEFERLLGVNRTGGAEMFLRAMAAPSRTAARRAVLRGLLCDPASMLRFAEDYGPRKLIAHVRGLPVHTARGSSRGERREP